MQHLGGLEEHWFIRVGFSETVFHGLTNLRLTKTQAFSGWTVLESTAHPGRPDHTDHRLLASSLKKKKRKKFKKEKKKSREKKPKKLVKSRPSKEFGKFNNSSFSFFRECRKSMDIYKNRKI